MWEKGDVESCLLPKSLTAGGQTKDVCFSNAELEGLKSLGRKKICDVNSNSLTLLIWICAVAGILIWADAAEIPLTSFSPFERSSLTFGRFLALYCQELWGYCHQKPTTVCEIL